MSLFSPAEIHQPVCILKQFLLFISSHLVSFFFFFWSNSIPHKRVFPLVCFSCSPQTRHCSFRCLAEYAKSVSERKRESKTTTTTKKRVDVKTHFLLLNTRQKTRKMADGEHQQCEGAISTTTITDDGRNDGGKNVQGIQNSKKKKKSKRDQKKKSTSGKR